jgi:drug/metabolite transporter (DMT)-like permease
VVLASIIIIEGVFIYLKSAGDSGTLTIAAIPLLAAVALMVTAYRPKWINMPVTIKNYRQVELKAQSARVIALVVALFPAFFANPECMKGPSGTIIGIGFAAIVMVIVIYYVWRIEKAQ